MPRPTATSARKTALTLAIWVGLLLAGALLTLAQDRGQICLQAYADDNGNSIRDDVEAAISRGVGASLLNDRGITIASLLLDDAPYGDGLFCFDGLLAGDYQLVITSSEYEATTSAEASASVQPGAAPAIIDVGVKPLTGEILSDRGGIVGSLGPAARQTLIIAGLAAGIVVALSLLGLLIYFRVIRRHARNWRMSRSHSAPLVAPAGLPPCRHDVVNDTRPPGRALDPNQGSPLLFADDDRDLAGSR